MAGNSNILVGGLFLRPELAKKQEAAAEAVAEWESLSELEQAVVKQRLDEAVVILRADAQARGPSVLGAPDDALASLILQALAEAIADDPAAVIDVAGNKEAKFDNLDVLGWASHIPIAWLRGRFDRHPWVSPSVTPDAIPDQARIALLGDWGSGLYGAPAMAAAITADARPYSALIHLGDVYYAGTKRAVRDRFLALWPNRPEALSRACNSNHEMYTGGDGYFELTLPTFKQQSSAFALRNAHWLVVGMDTAYTEGGLAEGQATWIEGLVAASPGRKVILLSHHQGLSLYDGPAHEAVTRLTSLLQSGVVYAWYWGHEHRCVLFDRDPTFGYWGRCVGHSGFPEFRLGNYHEAGPALPTTKATQVWLAVPGRNGAPHGHVLDGPNPYVPDSPGRYVPHGYATIELDGPDLVERIHDADGAVLAVVRRNDDGTSTPVLP